MFACKRLNTVGENTCVMCVCFVYASCRESYRYHDFVVCHKLCIYIFRNHTASHPNIVSMNKPRWFRFLQTHKVMLTEQSKPRRPVDPMCVRTPHTITIYTEQMMYGTGQSLNRSICERRRRWHECPRRRWNAHTLLAFKDDRADDATT